MHMVLFDEDIDIVNVSMFCVDDVNLPSEEDEGTPYQTPKKATSSHLVASSSSLQPHTPVPASTPVASRDAPSFGASSASFSPQITSTPQGLPSTHHSPVHLSRSAKRREERPSVELPSPKRVLSLRYSPSYSGMLQVS